MFKKRKREIIQNVSNQTIILGPSSSNSFGQESLGLGQVRGNGLLVLTDKELYFGMFLPKKDFHIPSDQIHTVSTPKSHLKKTKSRTLLKIEFTNKEGVMDSIAWLVRELDLWVNTLNNEIKRKEF